MLYAEWKGRDRLMTLTIEIPEHLEAALKTQAGAQGVSAEQYARRVLESASRPAAHRGSIFRK